MGIRETASDLKKELIQQKSNLQNKWDNHRSNYIAAQRSRRRVALEEVKKILTNTPNITKVSRDVEYVKNIHSIDKELIDAMKVVIPPAFVNDEVKEEDEESTAFGVTDVKTDRSKTSPARREARKRRMKSGQHRIKQYENRLR